MRRDQPPVRERRHRLSNRCECVESRRMRYNPDDLGLRREEYAAQRFAKAATPSDMDARE